MDDLVHGVIFFEAGHALHFGRYKTEVQLRMFHWRAFAEFIPVCLNGGWVQLKDFAEDKMQVLNIRGIILVCESDCFIEDRLKDVEFTRHVILKIQTAHPASTMSCLTPNFKIPQVGL